MNNLRSGWRIGFQKFKSWRRANFIAFILALGISLGEGVIPNPLTRQSVAVPLRSLSPPEEIVPTMPYKVIGDRQGNVTVLNPNNGEVVRTFQMQPGVVVRETFLLDNGRTVGASQKDNAIFWDLESGREISRIDQRVYGFSDDKKMFWTYGSKGLLVYSYPEMTVSCELVKEPAREGNKGGIGPEFFDFSPNGRFLLLINMLGFPSTDEDYPRGSGGPILGPLGAGIRQIYDLQLCKKIPSDLFRFGIRGEFSEDSKFYVMRGVFLLIGEKPSLYTVRLNLETYEMVQEFERLFNESP